MPKCSSSFIANFFQKMFIKSEDSAIIRIFFMKKEVI